MIGLKGIGIRNLWDSVGAKGWPPFDFDLDEQTFNPGMAKRTGQAAFAAAPIVQGDWDSAGTGDVLSFVRGDLIDDYWYENFDGSQWFLFVSWVPEVNFDAGAGKLYLMYASAAHYFAYDYDNARFELCVGTQTLTAASNIVAGTSVALAVGGSSVNPIDGSNYGRISINDVHTYGMTTAPRRAHPTRPSISAATTGPTLATLFWRGSCCCGIFRLTARMGLTWGWAMSSTWCTQQGPRLTLLP